MLFSCQQIVQCIHLGAVADVDALVTALHDVYQLPGKKEQKERHGIFHCSVGLMSRVRNTHHITRQQRMNWEPAIVICLYITLVCVCVHSKS